MRNAHQKYICYPSVVCAGVETEITIFPHDISRYFKDDVKYELAVIGLRDDMVDYFDPIDFDIPHEIKDGCLKFRYSYLQKCPWLLPAAWVHRIVGNPGSWKRYLHHVRGIANADTEEALRLKKLYREIGL